MRSACFLLTIFLLGMAGCGNSTDSAQTDMADQTAPSVEEKRLIAEAEGLTAQGRLAEAIASYEKVLKTRPALPEPYFRLGALYFKLGMKSRAQEYYYQAIDKNFRNPEIYFHMGYIKETEGKYQDALEWYLKAEEKGVDSAELYFNLGNVLARLGSLTSSMDYYKKAVSVNPDHVDGFINLAIVAFQMGEVADASFYLDKARELGYNPPAEFLESIEKASK